jgi:Glycosyltransferase
MNKPIRILFLTLLPEIGASSRYRVYQFLPHLKRLGYAFRVSPLISERQFLMGFNVRYVNFIYKLFRSLYAIVAGVLRRTYDIATAGNYDIVFIQKDILLPGMDVLLRMINHRIIFDFDDALYAQNPAVKRLHRWLSYQRKAVLDRMLKISSIVLVENEWNKSYAMNYCKDIRILTGPIDTDRFTPAHNRKPCAAVVVGWIGAPTTAPNLKLIEPVFCRLTIKYPDLVFRFVGSGNFPFDNTLAIERHDWRLSTEVELLQSFDIGIMPIEDHAWARGKGGTKLLQYMATGLPCVASPVGINKEIVVHGKTGFLTETERDWFERLSFLIENSQERRQMGAHGRTRAEEHYSLHQAVLVWDKIFREVISTKR